ncbi:coiled-coil domain-containing protein 73 isoform X2 [Engystomops pustulosus]|uniref:coiled-coil domain-containing protein 73 isoform X2 n=1 Tax=Engystomops pustulosus TaxID=76066 RepID=UPI003AFAC43D
MAITESALRMENNEMDIENPSYTLKGSSETLLPIQLFEFKSHLLEAVEELRMGRLAKIQYEEQINKILMEKQELTWKYESLSKQEDIVEKKHNDSQAVLKKQLQAKMCLIEEEKGRFQLDAETKEKENISLREDIKALQIAKYSYQKKAQEMEQKLQLHVLAKEDHIKQLSECKKCIGNVTQQFGMIKEAHERLEQTVQAAIQNNKKLNSEINQKKSDIEQLKKELKNLSSDFLNYKLTYKQRADAENTSLAEKEQHVRELEERLHTETEINKKLMEENASMKEGKQDDIRTLSNMRNLLQRHTQTIISLENHLSALKEDYKTLERDNELQRAKATKNEEKFLALRQEHKQAFTEWKAQKENLDIEFDNAKKELESIKELNNNCNKELLNKTPEAEMQVEDEQSSCIMDITSCDTQTNTYEKNCPGANTSTSYPGRASDVSLPVISNEIQEMDESQAEIVQGDKRHVSEEQRDESALTENKERFSAAERNVTESCDGNCTEDEAPADKTRMKVGDEDEESTMIESIKMLPDNNKPPAVCGGDASQQTDSSHCKSGDGTREEVYIVIDKPDRTDNDSRVLINETCSKESQLLDQTIERGTTRHISLTENSPCCVLGDGSHYPLPVVDREASKISAESYSQDQIQQSIEELIGTTNESLHGPSAGGLLSKQSGRVDPNLVESTYTTKSCIDMETAHHTGILDQEDNICTSYSSHGQVGKPSVDPVLDPKTGDGHLQSSQHSANREVSQVTVTSADYCLDTGDNNHREEATECDVNVEREIHCQQRDHTNDPLKVDKENYTTGTGCISQEVSGELSHEESTAKPKEETSKPNGRSPVHLSNLVECIYLPGSNPRDSLNISLSEQTNHILSKLSGQDVRSRAEQVPRKDHSAERNAEQAFPNPSIPPLATTLDKSHVIDKGNLFPAITDPTRSQFINRPTTTPMAFTTGNRDSYDISNIQRQISAIERFLFHNKLNGSRKRKLDETPPPEE